MIPESTWNATQLRKKLAALVTKDGRTRKPINCIRTGAELKNAAETLVSFASLARGGCTEVWVECSRQPDFYELTKMLFELPAGAAYPKSEGDVEEMVRNGVLIIGIKVRPESMDHCMLRGEVVQRWAAADAVGSVRNVLETAGFPCQDFCRGGQGLRLMGPRIYVILAWVVSVWSHRPKRCFIENSSLFPQWLVKFLFGHIFRIHCEDLSPPDVSRFGVNRHRHYFGMVRLESKVAEQLERRVTIKSAMESVLGGLDPESRHVRDKGFFIACVTDEALARMCLKPRAAKCLKHLMAKHPDVAVFGLENSQEWISGMKDNLLASITRGSTRRYCPELGRWLLAPERLLAHGLPITDWAATALGTRQRTELLHSPPAAQSDMAGNSMHLACVMSMVAFVCLSGG